MNTYEELKAHFEKGGVLKLNLTGIRGNLSGPTITKIANEEPNIIKHCDDEVFFYCTTPDGIDRAYPCEPRLAGHFIEAVRDAA